MKRGTVDYQLTVEPFELNANGDRIVTSIRGKRKLYKKKKLSHEEQAFAKSKISWTLNPNPD